MQAQSSEFQTRAVERLFVAVVNQAVLDVLEHGEEAEDAERWLLSKDFVMWAGVKLINGLFVFRYMPHYTSFIEQLYVK